ncbi:CoA synthetase [Elioraea sp. Yellowstone]|jgi:glutaconate CoA-transferase subunit B|uniref:CoA-transferase n=1 Tax=Elioraea sp. Yellowstone TaxID=2592070 RepID=UPI00114F5D9D|nr:CoA-transferase [Elioraea sp. Yellowstone]TQF77262.1 CoA synthetase [Elioraea sp. Yellowstone]
MTVSREELLIAAIADLIAAPNPHPVRHAAVGAASPIPAHAVMLARHRGLDVRLSLLQQRVGNPFTEGARELFDLAGQGRIDLFFLGGAQIDGQANINLVGTGTPAGSSARLPGNFGSAFMAFTVPRVILFREEHSPRVLVPKVDYVSAPGVSAAGVYRRGSPQALVTGRCVFAFDAVRARFTLASLHPGETRESIRENTGFDYDEPTHVPETRGPSEDDRAALAGPIRAALEDTYPQFCARVFGARAA